MRALVIQGLLLLALTATATLLTWKFHPRAPALYLIEEPPGEGEVSIQQALEWEAGGGVIWLDARPQEKYDQGHIPGAILLNEFDFHRHRLVVSTCDDESREFPLEPQTTADFYAQIMGALDELGLPVKIVAKPNEVDPAIPFAEDTVHASYDADAVHRFWRALLQVDRVFTRFRAGFRGKVSPSHFFWGSFDLAVTRFSGREAPAHPGGYPNMPADVMAEAYSHEVSSAGFWPGGDVLPEPIFYSYAYPSPDGFAEAPVQPGAAAWNTDLGEFVLPYDAVRTAADPEADLMAFLESTYLAAARAANWDIEALAQTFRP